MKKENTAIRLKRIMSERNIRQIDILNLSKPICEQYGVKMNRSDISQYCSGKVEPNQDKLFVLSKALNVNESWLMGYGDPEIPKPNSINNSVDRYEDQIIPIVRKRFPLLGEIACGEPIFADQGRESYIMSGTDIVADFCVKARGDSMINARIYDGDIVFIRKTDEVEDGCIYAVGIDDEVTLKRIYYNEGIFQLIPENPAYKPKVITGEALDHITILGKAVAFQSDVR